MPTKAVFLDRDSVLIEDPGVLADTSGVKLLPGVELALRSLAQVGYKLIVVTNQSAVARGLLTEEALAAIHDELNRQLRERGVVLDGIYYCPYHPEGTVDRYAHDSDERKPKPGMLLRAARDFDIELPESWMIGDSPHDVEAGQRAGCRTVRVRSSHETWYGEKGAPDEDVQADFTVRNLVDAARIVLRERQGPIGAGGHVAGVDSVMALGALADAERAAASEHVTSNRDILQEILQNVRQIARREHQHEFSMGKLAGGIIQALALVALVVGFIGFISVGDPTSNTPRFWNSLAWLSIATVLELMALTCFVLSRHE
jgi:D,D-heptose 1,7-bisphosphate phosphatase